MADKSTEIEIGIIEVNSDRLTDIDDFLLDDENITTIECPFPHVTSAVGAFQNCVNLTTFNGILPKLTDGSRMFYDTKLSEFTSDLQSLENGTLMFYSTKLSEFTTDLQSLKNGTQMFYASSLSNFNSNLKSLTTYSQMFGDTKLTSFDGDTINISDKGSVFMTNSGLSNSQDTLTTFYCNLPNMTDTSYMFKQYTALQKFESYLPKVDLADGMFQGCTALQTVDITGEETAQSQNQWQSCNEMFRDCTSLNENGIKNLNLIKNVQNGGTMFINSGITSIPSNWEFTNLVYANAMFKSSKLNSVTITENTFPILNAEDFKKKFPDYASYDSLVKNVATGMFENCLNLTTVNFDVSTIPNGGVMFSGCSSLTTCNSANFASGGSYSNMFSGCKFNKQSAQIIFDAADAANVSSLHIGIGFPLDENNDFVINNSLVKYSDNQWQSGDGRIMIVCTQ